MTEFWAIPKEVAARTEISIEARFLFGILWTRKNGENVAWPGQATLAATMGCGERSIRRYIDELVAANLIEVEQQGLRRTNRYRILNGQNDRSRPDTAVRSGPDTAVRSHSKRTEEQEQKKESLAPAAQEGTVTVRKDADIIAVFEVFQRTVNPAINYANRTYREAAAALIKAYGVEKVIRAAEYAVANVGRDMFPQVTNPHELREKFTRLASAFNRGSNAVVKIS